MEANRFEVYTMTDKAKRDRMFEEFRNSTEPNERQVVKFSGVRPVMVTNTADYETGHFIDLVVYTENGTRTAIGSDPEKLKQLRFCFESTFSVAYPFAVVDKDLIKKYAPKHGSARNPRKFPGRKKAS